MKVLMVCLGNICRSPLAEGIFRNLAEKRGLNVFVDSAGTGGWHSGQPPDKRSIQVAKRFGIDISALRARKFTKQDFEAFDLIFAMDRHNINDILALADSDIHKQKVKLMTYASHPDKPTDVPDPYYENEEAFYKVYSLLKMAIDSALNELVS